MCLILFSYRDHPRYKLVVAANRDEYYSRPTAPSEIWADHPQVLGGRDLQGNGTWLGVTKNGRIGMVTNYRDPKDKPPGAPSRGGLVAGFLVGSMDAPTYLSSLRDSNLEYAGFSLLLGRTDDLWFYSNRQGRVEPVQPGTHGLCNHLLNTPWPKVETGKAQLLVVLPRDGEDLDFDGLFGLLRDQTVADDRELPDSGIGRASERRLSPIFVATADYGTRCSTIITVDMEDRLLFVERTYSAGTAEFDEARHSFCLG